MTSAQLAKLGRRILALLATGSGATSKALSADLVAFVTALAVVDGRKAPRLDAGPVTPDDLKAIEHLVDVEVRYHDGEPVPHDPPRTGSVRDHLFQRLAARARGPLGEDIFVELVGTYVKDGQLVPVRQSAMHRKWSELRRLHRRLVMICGVGLGKTSSALFHLVWSLGRNVNLRCIVVGNTSARGSGMLRAVQDLITSDAVKAIFPELQPDPKGPWSTTEAMVARPLIAKEPSISAFGVTGAMQSLRADLIICDDLVDKENSATAALIEDLVEIFTSTIETRLWPDGRLIYSGTPWKPNDLLARLADNELYAVARFPWLSVDDAGNEVSVWPEVITPEVVREKRIALSSKPGDFERFCMCSPLPPDETSLFKAAAVQAAITDDLRPGLDKPPRLIEDLGPLASTETVVCGVDLSTGSASRRADDSSIATLIYDEGERASGSTPGRPDTWTLIGLDSGKWPIAESRSRISDTDDVMQPSVIYVEDNGFQKSLIETWRRDGIDSLAPFTSTAQSRHDLATGLPALAAAFGEGGRFRIPKWLAESPSGRKLIHALMFFGNGEKHLDDRLSSVLIAVSGTLVARRTAKREIPRATMRTIGGESSNALAEARKAAEATARETERAAVKQAERRSRLAKLFDVPPLDDERINNDREAARHARHAAGIEPGNGFTFTVGAR